VIPDDQVEEVRARADIVDVVGEWVDLKKAGKEYKARCPFHEERTPSFYVVPDKGFYNCFGCGENGDVFSFVMKKAGLDFVEAVKHVAARSGVEIREVSRQQEEDDPLRPLHAANAFAADWFRRQLADEAAGAEARAYLEGRGIDAETIERFELGWAPDDWRGLRDAAATHGIGDDLLLACGLLTTSENAPEPYDRFRGRIIFPIHRVGGQVVAFGGRIIGGGGGPKYLNSPETPVYQKGEVLYGLHRSRHAVRREGGALVVEGYMDLVALAAAGFEHVVATLGTAMTPEHARLLTRYTTKVWLLFDSDAAGLRATFKAGDILLANGLHPAVVTLPPGEDPDTLVRGEGPEALARYVDQAVDILDRKLQILEERDWFATIDRRRDAVDKLLPTLRATSDPTLRDIYIDQVAERTGVRRRTLEAELSRPDTPARRQPTPARRGNRERRPAYPSETRASSRLRMGPESRLLKVLARDRERRHEHLEYALIRVGPEDFRGEADRAAFQAFMDDPELDDAPETLDPRVASYLRRLLTEPADDGELAEGTRIFREAVNQLAEHRLYRQMEELQAAIEAAATDDEKAALIQDKQRLRAEAAELGVRWGPAARKYARGFNETPRGT
jgi:DNA primase